jgi:hypothetical protein
MTRNTWFAVGGGLASVAVLAGAFAVGYSEPPAPPSDRSKDQVEVGTKRAIAQPPAPAPAPAAVDLKDVTKRRVERPTEEVLALLKETVAKAEAADSGFVNPKVAPGKVTWHKDFAEACAASGKSGKPVLLFQMMGKLDDQFC